MIGVQGGAVLSVSRRVIHAQIARCRALACLCVLCLWPAATRACDLALLLALDVSGSVNSRDYGIQRDGLAAALADPVIADALAAQRARVAVLQWTGSGRQRITIPWRAVESPADALALAAEVAADRRLWGTGYSTAMGEALQLGADAFAQVPDCRRLVIDISGDGRSNQGLAPAAVRPRMEALGITVNALVIRGVEPFLTEWFRSEVVTGPGAFAVEAAGYGEYAAAIRRKLEREVVRQIAAPLAGAGAPP